MDALRRIYEKYKPDLLSFLRFREIAQQTGESINTIQSRYRYGLAKLQSLLNGEVDL